ncbi:MAG: hypothetical protein OR994_08750, partial [Candidatus Poseidoniales archaeon]|nr:hypothetical protein [Candidatus Poseidoniales archaeon]
MKRLPRTNSMLASLLLLAVLLPNSSAIDTSSSGSNSEITSNLEDGAWFNETLSIDGSTTIPAQDANWILYDVTEPYSDWVVLRSGDYFSEVIPVDEGLWVWSITVDVQGLNCTCWLEISQPVGLEKEFLNRIIFIGEGPHNPVISPLHEGTIIVDEPVQLSAIGVLADSNNSETKLSLSWCYAPLGACDGNITTSIVNITWVDDEGTFMISATQLGLHDGVWAFTYTLQDEYLRFSPPVEVRVYVDQTDPEAELICSQQALEGDLVIIDGSESRDGVWGPNLQALWYVTQPDGVLRVAEQSETDGMVFSLLPEQSGIYSIQIDIVDMVGRRSSATDTINIENVEPTLNLLIDDLEISNLNSWKLVDGEDLEMFALVQDTDSDKASMNYEWYLNNELISTSAQLKAENLNVGTHELRLVIIDNDGANITHEMDIIVSGKSDSTKDGFN